MVAVEFETQAQNGMIKIPEEYREMAQGELRVILLKGEEKSKTADSSQGIEIKKILKQIQGKNIFKSIDNPVEWQRTIRDEWS